jgi:hypothetical protein
MRREIEEIASDETPQEEEAQAASAPAAEPTAISAAAPAAAAAAAPAAVVSTTDRAKLKELVLKYSLEPEVKAWLLNAPAQDELLPLLAAMADIARTTTAPIESRVREELQNALSYIKDRDGGGRKDNHELRAIVETLQRLEDSTAASFSNAAQMSANLMSKLHMFNQALMRQISETYLSDEAQRKKGIVEKLEVFTGWIVGVLAATAFVSLAIGFTAGYLWNKSAPQPQQTVAQEVRTEQIERGKG